MSAFKLEYKDYEFTILLDQDADHIPIERWTILSKEDKDLLESGEMAYFSLTITSQYKDEKVVHFVPGVQLPVDEEEQEIDLEMILIEEGLLEDILKHWSIRSSEDKNPSWA